MAPNSFSGAEDAERPPPEGADSGAPVPPAGGTLRSAGLVSGLTMFSRVLGLIRDILLVRLFFGWVLDAFVLAFTIPNLFRRLFGEGALSSAFIPVFVERREAGDPEGASRLASTIMTLLVAGLGAAAALGVLVSLGMGLGGVGGEKAALVWKLLAIMLPYVVFICAAALMMAILNAGGHFAAPAAAPILLNVVLIVAMLWVCPLLGGAPETHVYALAVAVLIGGVLQLGVQLPFARGGEVRLRPRWDTADPQVRKVGAALGPVILGLAVFQINVLFDRLIAEFLVPHDGAVSVLFLANRLIQLPLGVFAIALGTVALPALSALEARGEHVAARKALGKTLETAFFIIAPAAVGLAILAAPQALAVSRGGPIIDLFYAYGRFAADLAAQARAGRVVVLYAAGLLAFGGVILLTRAFYARGDTRTPMRVGMIAVAANLILNLALVRFMHESGLALASSISAFLQMGLLAVLLWRRDPDPKRRAPTMPLAPALGAVAGLLAAAVGAALFFQRVLIPTICYRLEPLFGVVRGVKNETLLDARLDQAALVGGTQIAAGLFCVGLFAAVGRLSRDAVATRTAQRVWKIGLAVLPMAILVHWFMWSLPPDGETLLIPAQRVAFPVLIGVLSYWFFGSMGQLEEYVEVRRAIGQAFGARWSWLRKRFGK